MKTKQPTMDTNAATSSTETPNKEDTGLKINRGDNQQSTGKHDSWEKTWGTEMSLIAGLDSYGCVFTALLL